MIIKLNAIPICPYVSEKRSATIKKLTAVSAFKLLFRESSKKFLEIFNRFPTRSVVRELIASEKL